MNNMDQNNVNINQNKMVSKLNALPKSQKIQLCIAVLLTLAVIVAMPVAAWFSFEKGMAVSTKINSPATLSIMAGGPKGSEQDIINFELSNIDTEDTSYKHYDEGGKRYYYKDYVFCVKGKAISQYDLQLAYTTNIPFKYEVYRAIQDDTLDENADSTIIYQSIDKTVTQKYRLARVKVETVDGVEQVVKSNGEIVYENYNTPLSPDYLNVENGDRSVANNELTSRSYTSPDQYQLYANPVYWIKRNINVYSEEKYDEGFTHSYVLRVIWQMVDNDVDDERIDIVQNNKETDLLYITAAVS